MLILGGGGGGGEVKMGNANERGLQILDFQRLAFLYLTLSQVGN